MGLPTVISVVRWCFFLDCKRVIFEHEFFVVSVAWLIPACLGLRHRALKMCHLSEKSSESMESELKQKIIGYDVSILRCAGCVAEIVESIGQVSDRAVCRWLACINPHSYAESLKDEMFAAALHDADWLVPDGSGMVLASRILGGNIRDRVTGSDIFHSVSVDLNKRGSARVFFLGSTEKTLAKIRIRMAEDYPNLVIVGTYSPPFKPSYSDDELDDMVDAINSAGADILWVGMTAPKQEKWLLCQAPRLNVKFAAAIGAVFDFYTGNVKRSHPIFQRLHLEWFPRLVQEPRRLWRRMGVSAPIFIWHVLRQRLGLNEE